MWKHLVARLRPKAWKQARASYGPEPSRRADEVGVPERVEAVLEGSAPYLLRDVIGLEALKALPAPLVPSRFVRDLPVTAAEVAAFVRERGLPRGFFPGKRLELREDEGRWVIVVRDERGGVDLEEAHPDRADAELAALRHYWPVLQPFVLGQLP
ncbi:MAG TPA: hypothetical protein VGK43_07745 [Solirubrobacterales bacterium]